MNKLSKEKQQQVIVVIVVAVAVVAGLLWFVVGAQFKSLGVTKKAIADAEAKIKAGNDTVKQKAAVAAELEAVKAKVGSIEDTMGSGDLFSWGVTTIKNFSLGRQVEVPNFSREERIKAGLLPEFPYEAVKYTVRGHAFYQDFGKFIAAFENMYPHMRVQNLDLVPSVDPTATAGDKEKLAFRMEIVALVRPSPEEVEKAKKDKEAALKAATAKKK